MKSGLVIIYESDMAYGEGLLGQIKQRRDFPFEIKLITTAQALEEINSEVVMLLMDEKQEEVRLKGNIRRVIYLSEDVQDSNHLYRYQSVDQLVEHMKEYCEVEKGEETPNLGSGGIIAIYSPIGGCGKTTVAKEVAAHISASGGKVYYLDFELVTSSLGDKKADFFYDLHTRTLFEKGEWNEHFSAVDGVWQLQTSLYNKELWDMKVEDMEYLVSGLREKLKFEYFIFDIGFINQSVITLLKECDYWIIPYKKGEVEMNKIENMKKLISFCCDVNLEHKMIEVDMGQGMDELWKGLVL